MGLLNRFFKSPEELAKDVALKDEDFLRAWNDYHKTLYEKTVLIVLLSNNNYLQTVPKLQKLLALELSDIVGEKKTEERLIGDLKSLEKDKRLQRVQSLYDRICYAESKYRYIYKLLDELHVSLVAQLHIVEQLLSAKDVDALISHLKSQSAIEREVIKQIDALETFHGLFLALVKGEHIISRMDTKEKQILKRMSLILAEWFRIKDLPGPWRKKGITYEWANKVYTGLKAHIDSKMPDVIEGWHDNVDFEYVNHPDFVNYVKQCALELGENPSNEMINVFAHTFRELYNDKKYAKAN